MSQQEKQKHKVKVRQCTVEQDRDGPTESGQELRDVMEMTRDSPPTGSKKKALLFHTFGGEVCRMDELRTTAPDFTVALCVANMFFLSIGVIVYEDGQDSNCEDGQG